MDENEIGSIIVDCAINIHRNLGPGLLETVYQVLLAHELEKRTLNVRCEVPIAIEYEGIQFNEGFRADMVVNNKVILELKSVEKVVSIHKKQLLTYLRLTGMKLGYLLNFGDVLMKDGISRIINGSL
jgi:GxxExxY protein